jgi:hypothetical protein
MAAKERPQSICLAEVAFIDGSRECERACDGYRLATSESGALSYSGGGRYVWLALLGRW